jgi:hypothetical protein
MKKHINLKKTCIKELNSSFQYTNDQLLVLSLIPYDNDGKQNIKMKDIKDIKHIHANRSKLLTVLTQIEKLKNKECIYCLEKFDKIQDLRQHVLIDCFPKEMEKELPKSIPHNVINNITSNMNDSNNTANDSHNTTTSSYNDSHNTINNDSHNTINNDSHNTINNDSHDTINNITNITLNIQTPISFNENWDLSKISEFEKKFEILCSDIMYTTLLNKIFENKVNLNVVVDKQKNVGFVYKNDDEKYVKMNLDDITENSMEKLHNNLLEINNEVKKGESHKNISEFNEKRIKNKLTDYKKTPDTKKKVNEFIAEMFDKKKEDAFDISKNIQNICDFGY